LPSVKPWGDIPANMAPIIALDRKAAGIPDTTDAGEVLDFHSLRHSYITRLAKSGASLKTTQLLARHSSIELTAKVYSHLGIADTSGALEALPGIEVSKTSSETA